MILLLVLVVPAFILLLYTVVPGLLHDCVNKLATAGTNSVISDTQKGSTTESQQKVRICTTQQTSCIIEWL